MFCRSFWAHNGNWKSALFEGWEDSPLPEEAEQEEESCKAVSVSQNKFYWGGGVLWENVSYSIVNLHYICKRLQIVYTYCRKIKLPLRTREEVVALNTKLKDAQPLQDDLAKYLAGVVAHYHKIAANCRTFNALNVACGALFGRFDLVCFIVMEFDKRFESKAPKKLDELLYQKLVKLPLNTHGQMVSKVVDQAMSLLIAAEVIKSKKVKISRQ